MATAADITRALACARSRCDCNASARKGYGDTHCPAHGDEKVSLSVTERDGKVLVCCHAGCSQDEVVAALKERGLWGSPARNGCHTDRPIARTPAIQTGPAVVTDHEIRDAAGALAAIHRRTDQVTGKAFSWLQPNGSFGLGGTPVAELPLFQSETLAALAPSAPVVLVEGEKSALALAAAVGPKVGVVATVTGAAATPSDATLRPLAGRRVVLWPDEDQVGHDHMGRIGSRLRGLGCQSVAVVSWADAPQHADAWDYCASHGRDEVLGLLRAARPLEDTAAAQGPNVAANLPWQTAVELFAGNPEAIEWAWQDFFPFGAVVEVHGKVKVGKSTFLGHVLKAILEGRDFLERPTTKVPVVYLTEEGPASFRRLLKRCRLEDCIDLHIVSKRQVARLSWEDLVEAARAKMTLTGARVMVVDTLGKLVGFQDEDENSAGKAMAAMTPIQALVTELNALAVVSRHERKSGGDIGDSARGSSQLAGDADIVLRLSKAGCAGGAERRVLGAIGRFDETPDELTLQLDPDGYRLVGPDDARDRAGEAVLELVPEGEESAVAVVDLLPELKESGHQRSNVYAAVKHLVATGELVESEGNGPRGHKRTLISRPIVQMGYGVVGRSALRSNPVSSVVTLKTAALAVSDRPARPTIGALDGRTDGADEPGKPRSSRGPLDGLDEVSKAPSTPTTSRPGDQGAGGVAASPPLPEPLAAGRPAHAGVAPVGQPEPLPRGRGYECDHCRKPAATLKVGPAELCAACVEERRQKAAGKVVGGAAAVPPAVEVEL